MGGIQCPHVIFSKNKNYLSNQMHSFFPRTKITWGASDTTHPSSTTHNIPHQHTTHPTHPQRKSGALMPDISWAPPHSLPIR